MRESVREMTEATTPEETPEEKTGRTDGERVAAFGKVLSAANICGPDAVASIVFAYVTETFKPATH